MKAWSPVPDFKASGYRFQVGDWAGESSEGRSETASVLPAKRRRGSVTISTEPLLNVLKAETYEVAAWKRLSASSQFTTSHHAPMYSGRRFWYFR